MPAPSVGEIAPDFLLPGTPGGKCYSLGDFRGRVVVLVFYPADDTPVCTAQLVTYNADLEQFADLGAEVVAVSPQDVASHEGFAARHGLEFPLLSDTDKHVGRAYGLVGPLGYYKRSVFVVDGNGVVRYAHRSSHGLTYRPTEELVTAVREASAPAGA
ncbi:MAG TPA: peroxiredoxin [Acidimicrobiales bacterium]|nr:peroxiredoxin [Acidimicrobiales bacterium]